ncbi:hypothetical protein EV175_000410 [Coemansia sp. RSA 1933]|nr:hypothetical protein EV175_000410 [Coemansia sp. RSA 1933]
MLYHYVYSRGFVEMYPKDDKYGRRSGSIKDCVYYSNNELVCRSNLGIITGRNEYNCKCVSSVRVVSHWGLEIPQYELTHLTLELDKISYKLPKIYAKPLRDLHLRDVPGDFTWHCFHDGLTTGRIEFTNLETFILAYQDQTDDQKAKSLKYSKQARPYGSYMLRFPKLSELTIENCPVDCDILFTDTMPSHIKLLDIDGGVNAIVAVSKLRCEKVNDLIFKSWDAETISVILNRWLVQQTVQPVQQRIKPGFKRPYRPFSSDHITVGVSDLVIFISSSLFDSPGLVGKRAEHALDLGNLPIDQVAQDVLGNRVGGYV